MSAYYKRGIWKVCVHWAEKPIDKDTFYVFADAGFLRGGNSDYESTKKRLYNWLLVGDEGSDQLFCCPIEDCGWVVDSAELVDDLSEESNEHAI